MSQTPIKLLKIAYLSAVGLLVALTVMSFFVLRQQIQGNEASAKLINTSAFLRTSSQRIALLGRNLVATSNLTERENIRQEIIYEAGRMELATNGLLRGDAGVGLPRTSSARIQSIFHAEPVWLNRKIVKFVEEARALAYSRESQLNANNPNLKYLRKEASGNKFLADLDILVKQYERESQARLDKLQSISSLITFGQLALLLLISLFIVRPLLRSVQKQLEDMNVLNGRLERRVAERSAVADMRAKKLRESERLVLLDPLTELLNRRGLQKVLAREIRASAKNGTQLVALIVDMDNFKSINDNHGHAVGDQALREVGRILRATLPPKDYICRIGGDEFLILFPQTPLSDAAFMAEKIRKEIESAQLLTTELVRVRMSASLGMVALSDAETSVEELLRMTHSALYKSKRAGKNRVSYEIPVSKAC
jgi:diguanylate cyclase (GGDEF)-like protein